MKKIIFKIVNLFFFLIFVITSSQSNYELNYEYKYGTKIIVPSFHNILFGIVDDKFMKVVENYGYKEKSLGGAYYAQIEKGLSSYSIEKSNGILSFIWIDDPVLDLQVRNQLNDMEKPIYLGNNKYKYRFRMKNKTVLIIRLISDGRHGLLSAYFE